MNQKDIELKTKINKFKKNLKVRESVEKAWLRYSDFIKIYPFKEHPEYIDNLTPDKLYNPGRGEYFFDWIEHKLKSLGHLFIGSARVWENARKDTDKLKQLLKILVDESVPISEKIDAHWEDIKGFGGDKHIAKKILFCYYTKEVIPAYKTEDLEDFVEEFDLEYRQRAYERYGREYEMLSVGQKFELLNGLVLELKHKFDEFKEWDNALFGSFLYAYFPPSRITERINKPKTKSKTTPFSHYGLIAEPQNEQEIVFLFSKFHRELGFPMINRIKTTFPDAEAINEKKEIKRIEFEQRASDFIVHGHNPKECDYIICWENDLTEERIKRKQLPKIISLKKELEK